MDTHIEAFYNEMVTTCMTPGAAKYLSVQHKQDFINGVKAAVDYGAKHGTPEFQLDVFLDMVWSIPFFLWSGCCDEKGEHEAKIQYFVQKLSNIPGGLL